MGEPDGEPIAVPELDVHQNGSHGPVASLDAVTTLIHSFASMMTAMEARISRQITDNATASKERWSRWETDFRDYREANDRRVEAIASDLHNHLEDRERNELVWNARLGPARKAATLISRNWKTVVVLLFAMLGALGIAQDILNDALHMLGMQ